MRESTRRFSCRSARSALAEGSALRLSNARVEQKDYMDEMARGDGDRDRLERRGRFRDHFFQRVGPRRKGHPEPAVDGRREPRNLSAAGVEDGDGSRDGFGRADRAGRRDRALGIGLGDSLNARRTCSGRNRRAAGRHQSRAQRDRPAAGKSTGSQWARRHDHSRSELPAIQMTLRRGARFVPGPHGVY